ncbi:MAG: SusC/RagA family TonB-linked outer membrane protein, partial [Marivirga sp.]|nr:SusC/RagA family TonB-linked outer membrane protein [Marivirga sp.]
MTFQCLGQFSVSGKIVTSEDMSPLPGVNIIIKGTTTGSITDVNGEYKISTNSPDDVIVVSFVGYRQQEIAISGRNVIDITLRSDARQLSEVVVTALGIRREEKSLGFAAQSVGESAVKDAKSNNWVNTLSGKVAGLNIQGTGAGP